MAKNYIPSQIQIESRKEALVWFQRMEWSWEVIDSILYKDFPTLETVRKMVYQHGPVRAYEILQQMVGQ